MKKSFLNTNFREVKTIAKTVLFCWALLFSFITLNSQTVNVYETKGNRSALVKKQAATSFANGGASGPTITINEGNTSQSIDGFGFMLTQGSAKVIKSMNDATQNSILNEIFNPNSGNGASVVRIGIGASDLSDSVYTYNNTAGDTAMNRFSLNGPDQRDLIPILKKILAINRNIKVLATPWTAPRWMKSNNSYIGGSLQPRYYAAYARYFIKYLDAMRAQGITIWAITPQNEPGNSHNEPSMSMNSGEQKNFINNHLGPAIQNSSHNTKIIAYDHNCDNLGFPIDVLKNSRFVDGAAFHLYDPGVNTAGMSRVHNETGKNIYFTEQFTSSTGNFDGDFGWHTEHVMIGSLRNWSKTVIEFNLASDTNFRPRTPGGCSTCLGAITVKGRTNFDRNVSYYIIAQVAKFIKPGAVRIATNNNGILNVAFRNRNGSRVLLVYNKDGGTKNVKVNWNGKNFRYNVSSRSAMTFVWSPSSNGGGNTSGAPIGRTIWLKANNGAANYISARNDINGAPLRAVGTAIRGWEQFIVVNAGGGKIALKAKSNNKYVQARINQTGAPLYASAGSIGTWEQFTWESRGAGKVALKSSQNSKYVQARLNIGAKPLAANANSARGWETYNWGFVAGGKELISEEDTLVSVSPNPAPSNSIVVVTGTTIGERIKIYNANGQKVSEVLARTVDQEVELGTLSMGIYFIKTNGSTLKLLIK